MKKFRPKTEPTGFKPTAGKKVVKAPDPDEGDEIGLDVNRLLAKRVQAAYRHARVRWESLKAGEPVTYTGSKRSRGAEGLCIDGDPAAMVRQPKPSVWARMVRFCEARKINPEQYVRVAFNGLSLRREAPEPEQLMGRVYEDKWKLMLSKLDAKLELSLRIQKEAATSAIVYRQKVLKEDKIRSCLMAFGAGDLPLTPLFRYCMGVSMEDDTFADLIEANEPQAVLQFECFRGAYKRVWGDLLPKGFAKFSRAVYPKLLADLGDGDAVNHISEDD